MIKTILLILLFLVILAILIVCVVGIIYLIVSPTYLAIRKRRFDNTRKIHYDILKVTLISLFEQYKDVSFNVTSDGLAGFLPKDDTINIKVIGFDDTSNLLFINLKITIRTHYPANDIEIETVVFSWTSTYWKLKKIHNELYKKELNKKRLKVIESIPESIKQKMKLNKI